MEDLNKMFILVKFYEEEKYSVLRLKKALSPDLAIDISVWDPHRSIDVLWNGVTYPGNILQFGESKKDMDILIDKLAEGNISVNDIPIRQGTDKLESRAAVKSAVPKDSSKSTMTKKSKCDIPLSQEFGLNILTEVKEKICDAPCEECIGWKEKVLKLKQKKAKKEFIIKCQMDKITNLEGQILKLKNKYSSLKSKYKEASVNQIEEDKTCLGTLKVSTNKLNMCRTSSYARFTGDLLEVVFGRNVLAESVIKGIRGSSTKTNILDPQKIQEIQSYVSSKFNIDQALVRAAIRRKLNTANRIFVLNNDNNQ